MAKIIGAKTSSQVGLSEIPDGSRFRCGDCEYYGGGRCHNDHPDLNWRHVEPNWCCNNYDHPRMKVIV